LVLFETTDNTVVSVETTSETSSEWMCRSNYILYYRLRPKAFDSSGGEGFILIRDSLSNRLKLSKKPRLEVRRGFRFEVL
jgi:hypothetical protein